MGDIPTGYVNLIIFHKCNSSFLIFLINRLPVPTIPTFNLLHLVAMDSIAITMVSYTITISMALIFAQKLNYKINSNQELLAMVIIIN